MAGVNAGQTGMISRKFGFYPLFCLPFCLFSVMKRWLGAMGRWFYSICTKLLRVMPASGARRQVALP
jgi:hypothetical protein